eukprot:GHVQ01016189.1.p1 GENE.GHVQ01016189.1~~GHVQ01016189.1.p1  ORF type:complete len:490 (-),score=49.07 GHVQ01016189.1:312-1781(-)
MQKEEQNARKEYVVAYASRTLTEAEKKWSTREQEALAIIWGCEHFRSYLFGSHFTVRSDHHSLQWLMKAETGRLARWSLRLQEFDFNIMYRTGKGNPHADALSRNPLLLEEKRESKLEEVMSPSCAFDSCTTDMAAWQRICGYLEVRAKLSETPNDIGGRTALTNAVLNGMTLVINGATRSVGCIVDEECEGNLPVVVISLEEQNAALQEIPGPRLPVYAEAQWVDDTGITVPSPKPLIDTALSREDECWDKYTRRHQEVIENDQKKLESLLSAPGDALCRAQLADPILRSLKELLPTRGHVANNITGIQTSQRRVGLPSHNSGEVISHVLTQGRAGRGGSRSSYHGRVSHDDSGDGDRGNRGLQQGMSSCLNYGSHGGALINTSEHSEESSLLLGPEVSYRNDSNPVGPLLVVFSETEGAAYDPEKGGDSWSHPMLIIDCNTRACHTPSHVSSATQADKSCALVESDAADVDDEESSENIIGHYEKSS